MNETKQDLIKGFYYSGSSSFLVNIISLSSSLVLARILTPEDFGLYAICLTALNLFLVLGNVGIGQGVIQNPDIETRDIESIFSLSLLIGVVLTLVFFLFADVISNWFDVTGVSSGLKLLSLSILFQTATVVPNAVLLKSQRFKDIRSVTIIAQLIGFVSVLCLSINGYGYYSLVFQYITMSCSKLIITWYLSNISPALPAKRSSIQKISRFIKYQFGFNITSYLNRNFDKIIVGKFLGSSNLGYYDMANKLILLPINNFRTIISPVLLPILSKHHDNKQTLLTSYIKFSKTIFTISLAITTLCFFSAKEIILIVFGDQWISSIAVFKILSLSIIFQILISTTGPVFQSINRTDLLFFSGTLGMIINMVLVAGGLFYSRDITLLAICITISFCIYYLIIIYKLINKGLGGQVTLFVFSHWSSLSYAVPLVLILQLINIIDLEFLFLSFIIKTSLSVLWCIIYLSKLNGGWIKTKTELLLLVNQKFNN